MTVFVFIFSVTIYKKSFDSFRHYCVETEQLPVDFHIVLSDIISGAGKYSHSPSVSDIPWILAYPVLSQHNIRKFKENS